MVRCPACGAESSPGASCARCAAPLPEPAAPARADAPRERPPLAGALGWGLVAVAVLAGFAALAFAAGTYPLILVPTLLLFLAGGGIGTAGAGILRGQPCGWGAAWAVVVAGFAYALWGLAHGYGSGLLGLALWGAVAGTLVTEPVLRHCGVRK